MNNIIFTAVITAVIMVTSMVWFLLTNVNHWEAENMIAILFIYAGGCASFYLLTVVINLSTPIECDNCGRELEEWESKWESKWGRK